MHIAGPADALTPRQRELVERVATLGRERFAPRAARHDRDASFPAENYADLREAGLLALAVPREHGGLGADLQTALLVVAEIGRHCGATALSLTMHVCACLWSGVVADALRMTPAQRAAHERARAGHYARIVGEGRVFSQPFSEGGPAEGGKAPWQTVARRVDGGWIVGGRKIFASLADAADFHGVLCTPDVAGATPADALYLAIPAGAPGVRIEGDWDPLGMRATASRTLVLDEVFVPESARLLPDGLHAQAVERFPHVFATLAAPYLGIAQAAFDFTVAWLRAEVPGMRPVMRRMYPTKQIAVAQMRVLLEQARAAYWQAVREAGVDPDADARMRLYAAQFGVMENAQAICALALRTCGGQSLMRDWPLERLYRDARCGSLMLPWTAELCLDRIGRDSLYGPGERDEAIE